MSLALMVASLVVGQACPPPSSWDAPPCALANVPGCVPGYWPVFDERLGRTVYVCAPRRAPATQPVVWVPSPAAPPAAPPVAPPAAAVATQQGEPRGHLAFVFMPGVSTYPSGNLERGAAAGQLALEMRGSTGGGRLRLVGTYVSFGKIGEISAKYDFLEGFPFRPFVAVGLGVASINPDPTIRGSGSGSAGVDLYLSRDFFLTGEWNGRVFTNGTQGPAHGLAVVDQKQTSFWVGLGFYGP